jgi:fatty acid desaturase
MRARRYSSMTSLLLASARVLSRENMGAGATRLGPDARSKQTREHVMHLEISGVRSVSILSHVRFIRGSDSLQHEPTRFGDSTMMRCDRRMRQSEEMSSRSVSFYARAIKPDLPGSALVPARSRLWWLPVHLLNVSLGIGSLAAGWVPWSLALGVSLSVGASFAGLTFLAHETLHGAVVRGRTARRMVGALCFAPFMISPRLWVAWHNGVHHGHTNRPGADPDSYPTLEQYADDPALRFVTDHLGPGGGRPNGVLSLLIGFTIQSGHMLLRAHHLGLLSARQRTWALLESALPAAGWAALALWIGWPAFVFGFVLPLLVANVIVMGFILTNHSLSPHTTVNDPLLNSLSVTVPRWVDWCTLRFGFHVEHHLFPWMSSRHAPAVRSLIRARWPERYQSMPLGKALLELHRTGRVYKNATTLSDPRGGKEWPTLLPREAPSGALVPATPGCPPSHRSLAPALDAAG